MANTVSISIDIGDGSTPKQVTLIPWFPGITVLQAMIIGQSMNPGTFNFRVLYHSFYGAFVDMIDDTPDQDGKYWLFAIDNQPSSVGVSEAVLLENAAGQNIEVEWAFAAPDQHVSTDQSRRKAKAYEKR